MEFSKIVQDKLVGTKDETARVNCLISIEIYDVHVKLFTDAKYNMYI